MYNTALNNFIWGKTPGNLQTRAKAADQPGKVCKAVDPMTKRHTVRRASILSQASPMFIKMHCIVS
jgi:hypothetical protein